MNILFFSRLFYPHIGGVEKHVLEISKRLIEKGHDVVIITEEVSTKDIPIYLQSRKKNLNRENIDSINIYRIPVGENNWFKKFRIWIQLWKLRNLIKTSDIVHCHDVFFWYFPFRFLFPYKKVFTTFHGYEDYPLRLKHILMHKISEKLSMGNICIGSFMKKWYKTKPTFISYGGVDISEIKNQKSTLRLRSGQASENSALFIGRLDEQTGILEYAKAVKIIRKKFQNFKFRIIGDGKFRKELERDFKVLGFNKNPEKYLKQCNFAFVSRYLSMLEAMAAKRLVFAIYDNPLKEDYLRMTPFAKYIIICSSALELVPKINFYLENVSEKEKLIGKAYNWANQQTWEEVVNIYLKLWKT